VRFAPRTRSRECSTFRVAGGFEVINASTV
jgi:hypothetical protein